MNFPGHVQSFAAACSARLPLRLRVTDERNGDAEELLVEKPYAIVGSAELCDVRLMHPEVSRHHAYIQLIDGQALCCDLGSRTGTHWGTMIHSRNWMPVGEPVHIGPYSICVVADDFSESGAEQGVRVRDAVRGRQAMLLSFMNARSRSGRTRISRVRNPVSLSGWSHLCNLRLQHHTVGRVHCSLVWTESGLWVVDLLCAGGTLVNGKPVSYARLDDDDELAIGRFHLKIAYGSSAEIPMLSAAELGEPIVGEPLEAARLEGPVESDLHPEGRNGRPTSNSPGMTHVDTRPISPRSALRPPLTALAVPMSTDLTGTGVSDAVAVALMQQFATMQQQLFEHTQQVLSMMAQTFHDAHSRQMELIRDELMRVHEVNRELQDLDRQRSSSGPPAALAAASDAAARNGAPPGALIGEAAGEHPGTGSGRVRGIRERIPSVAQSADRPATAASSEPAGEGGRSRTETSAPAVETAPSAGEFSAAATPVAHSGATAGPGRTPPSAAASGQDMRAWLANRINELEQERTSRWQKILQMLTQGRG